MKIACERCNKVVDEYFKDKYEKIRMDNEDKVLCKECYEKLMNWMYKPLLYEEVEQ